MLEALSRSRTGMRMARLVGRAVPRSASPRIVAFAADRMLADPDSNLSRNVRVNQYVVSGGTLAGEALDEAVRETVRNTARSLYDLYHTLGNTTAEDALIVRDEVWEAFLERERTDGPFVYSGVHLGNFDLLGRALGRDGWRMQVLSVADPNAGYGWQNDVRAEAGFEVTPVSVDSLKRAARSLASGHSVVTGHDRPLPEPDKAMPRFFGRPSRLPFLHVRLAMRAQVPVIAVAAPRDPDGRYHLLASDPIEVPGDPRDLDTLTRNAELCLEAIEPWIRAMPRQWAMPHLVWPDVDVPV